ncbi:ATP-binding protein [Vibrio gazogenes]|uniref:histidine kinase n=1 Tax=Vibrio gazogenes DSM 21264 = NBRC 103151 TaxID=1123492 RepID=A0A1M5EXA6_VIBGA|nr:ATP-binding protein [Vibrio gazogenes]USP14781.1 ATP-binding protein [Vibrio gazogenes]SHF83903.1 Signal transduction histidine kinase [Vibrio gazogenes DSM 21264] [Vibrio gazogenes DSM 21264 = NBRC 103151]SJN55164.1 Sensory/regulatory protein RpfC [Vibrio gazogenes]
MLKIRSFEHWSITTKITVSVILLVFLNIGVSAVHFYSLTQLKKSVEMISYASAVMVSVNDAAERVELFISSHDPDRLNEVKTIIEENVKTLAHLDLSELDSVHAEEVSALKRRMRYFSNTVDILGLATDMMNTETSNMTRQQTQLQNVATAIETHLMQQREQLEQRMSLQDAGTDRMFQVHQIIQSLRGGLHKMSSVLLPNTDGDIDQSLSDIRRALQAMFPVVNMLKENGVQAGWLSAIEQLEQAFILTRQDIQALKDTPSERQVVYAQMLVHLQTIEQLINRLESRVSAREGELNQMMDHLRTELGLLQNSVNVSRRFAERVAYLEAKTLTFLLRSTDDEAALVHETLDQLSHYSRILPSANISGSSLNAAVTVNALIDGYRDAFMRFRQASYALSRVHMKVREEADRASSLVSQFAKEQQVAADKHNAWSELSGTIVGGITALTALFIAWSTSRLIARPIISLAAVMRQLAAGELDVNITGVKRQDEVGTMSRAVKVFQENAVKVRAMEAEAESERQKIMAQLEQRVVERTEDLQHKTEQLEAQARELDRARIQAEAATHSKSVFLANMSHELRTPLNAILGYAQLIHRAPELNEQQKDGLNTIIQSGHHLLTLINDLLDLSKIEAGRMDMTPEAIDLSRCFQSVLEIIQIKAAEKGLTLKLQVMPQTLPWVFLDEKRLRQVLLNLLGNAVKYTDTGHIYLNVIAEPIDMEASVRVTFSVEDSGIGIDPEMQDVIFRPFERVGDKKCRIIGTGLGLAISQQLVKQMGGEIQVKSQAGVGSLFFFTLDLPVVTEKREQDVHSGQGHIIGYEGSRKHILIVDDVLENRMLLVDLLTDIGFETCEATEGQEGIEQATAKRPDLILMDIVMPVMDGLEATRRIRLIPELAALPILIVSASASQAEFTQGKEAGASGFVSKPIDRHRLLSQIGEQLDLTWVIDEQTSELEASSKVSDTSEWVVPSRTQLEELHHLALIGNMRHIRDWAENLQAEDTCYHAFATHLIDMAKSLQSRAILLLVNELLERKPAI